MDIIDMHVFYGTYGKGTNRLNYTLEHLKEVQTRYKPQYNIKFIVIPIIPEINKNMADLVKGNSDILLGAYVMVEPRKGFPWGYTSQEDLEQLLDRNESKGLKIIPELLKIPIDSPLLKPYFEVAEYKNIPILSHRSSSGLEYTSYEMIRNVIKKHPGLIMILAHSLHPNLIEGNSRLAKEFSNIYLDISSITGEVKKRAVRPDGTLEIIEWRYDSKVKEKGPEILTNAMEDPVLSTRILFGSDFPELEHSLYGFDQLAPENQQKIMDNARKLFKI